MKETHCLWETKEGKFKRSLTAEFLIVELLGAISNDTEIHFHINHQLCSLWRSFSV